MQINGTGPVSPTRNRSSEKASGGTTRASSGAPTDRFTSTVRKQQLDVPLLNQYTSGDENACGTTSLSMILKFLGKDIDRRDIDTKIRPIDGPTAPDDVVEYARDQGFNAELYTKGTVDELKTFLDRGIPLQVLVDPDEDPSDVTLHYMVVTGYETDPKTGKTNLFVNDPSGGISRRLDEDEFVKLWDNLKVKGVGTGVDRLFVAIAPKSEELPPSRRDGARIALALFEGIGVGESLVKKVTDLGEGLAKKASGAWNTVKGWFS